MMMSLLFFLEVVEKEIRLDFLRQNFKLNLLFENKNTYVNVLPTWWTNLGFTTKINWHSWRGLNPYKHICKVFFLKDGTILQILTRPHTCGELITYNWREQNLRVWETKSLHGGMLFFWPMLGALHDFQFYRSATKLTSCSPR